MPPRPRPLTPGQFPGAGASAGCEHYMRKCWLRAKCCGKYFPCRRCHDASETHSIDRRATEQLACVVCGETGQPVAERCRKCFTRFARYFCPVCKFFEDTEGSEAYHCDGCGICRVGKGLSVDNHHCERCTTCVPIQSRDTHPCRERSLDDRCPICADHLATSTDEVVLLQCGHALHSTCLSLQMASRRFTCSICNKTVGDMSEWYKALDEWIAKNVSPEEHANRVSRIFCFECERKTVVPFHTEYHKCGDCGAYNTQILDQFDEEA